MVGDKKSSGVPLGGEGLAESPDFGKVVFERAPKCLLCVHFPECLKNTEDEPDFKFQLNCKRFEPGDWLRELRFEKITSEKEIEKGKYLQEVEVYDGHGSFIEKKTEKVIDLNYFIRR